MELDGHINCGRSVRSYTDATCFNNIILIVIDTGWFIW